MLSRGISALRTEDIIYPYRIIEVLTLTLIEMHDYKEFEMISSVNKPGL